MCVVEQIYQKPEIYRILIPLPENPLRALNCYVLKLKEENLIIDTGFNHQECLAALKRGIEELRLDMVNTSLFLTHCHSDHIGLVNHVTDKNTKIYMSNEDFECTESLLRGRHWEETEERMRAEGLEKSLIERQRRVNPARICAPSELFPIIPVSEKSSLHLGGYELRFIFTPGHTPGHMCLYLPEKKILFSGDHILFDITPNITFWNGRDDSLGDYLESLEKIEKLEVQLVLPGHRQNQGNVYDRISQIKEHHQKRLEQIMEIIRREPGSSACQIGAGLTWKMRGKNWEEFPIQQKWFALGETIAHLDYLVKRHFIVRETGKNGVNVYIER